MKFQACTYKTSASAPFREGIIDGETGRLVPAEATHDYNLTSFPLCCIDTSYAG